MTIEFTKKRDTYSSEEFQKMYLELMNEREMNEILIRSLSHDLANPLSAIQLSVQKIKAKKLNEEELQKTLSVIERSTKASIEMITNIRKAVLTRSQEHLIAIEDVSLNKCLENTKELFQSQLASKSIQLELENELKADVLVRANEDALNDHVFSNIISNAIKFSHPHSKITVTIQDHQNQVMILFRDSGIGFQRNNRSLKSPINQLGTMGEQGSGFGLIIMGYFVRHFGGEFTIQSEKDGTNSGTTVTLKLNKA